MKFYERIYYNLTDSAKTRGLDKSKLEGYYECHHVVPKSLGGSDLPENLVLLTAREHFIAHWLLPRFTSGGDRSKMLHALAMMGNSQRLNRNITARQYEICRKANAEAMSATQKAKAKAGTHNSQTRGFKLALSERMKAKAETGTNPAQSPRVRKATSERMSVTNKAKLEAGTHPFLSPEFRQTNSERISARMKAKVKLGTHPTQSLRFRLASSIRAKARLEAGTHYFQSLEARQRMSVKITCNHCGKSTNPLLHSRWHGDKCKLLTEVGSHCLLTDKPTKWISCPVDGCDYGCPDGGNMAKHMKKCHQ